MMCEVCHKTSWRYKCPACLSKTCSLDCVQAHKTRASCSGQRDKTAFVAVKDFKETHLLSDYRFLEDVNRKTDSTTRDPLKNKRNSSHFFMENMRKKARQRGMTWLLLPSGLSKRKQNMTRVFRGRLFIWHIEWLFPLAQAKYTDRQPETAIINDSLRQFFSPECILPHVGHALRGYEGRENDLMLLMKVPKRPANDPRFYKLDQSLTFLDAFQGKTIVEFPAIHIVPASKAADYPLVDSNGTEGEESESPPPEKKSKVDSDSSLFRDSHDDYVELNPDAGNWEVMLKTGIPANFENSGKSQRRDRNSHQLGNPGTRNDVTTNVIDIAPPVDPDLQSRPHVAATVTMGEDDDDDDASLEEPRDLPEDSLTLAAPGVHPSKHESNDTGGNGLVGLQPTEALVPGECGHRGHIMDRQEVFDNYRSAIKCNDVAKLSSSKTVQSEALRDQTKSDYDFAKGDVQMNKVNGDKFTLESPQDAPGGTPVNQSNQTPLFAVDEPFRQECSGSDRSIGVTREITIKDEAEDERTIWITKL